MLNMLPPVINDIHPIATCYNISTLNRFKNEYQNEGEFYRQKSPVKFLSQGFYIL